MVVSMPALAAVAESTLTPAVALPLQSGAVDYVGVLTRGAIRIAGLGVFSFLVALCVSALYRWYFRQAVSAALGTFAGVAGVALYLNTKTAFASVVANQAAVFDPGEIVFNLAAFAVAVALGAPGARGGDRLAVEAFAFLGTREVDGEVGQLVKVVGRVVAVEIPDEIDDVDGYDPVAEETKEKMANKTLLFPRGLTVADLEARVAARLREDYDVGYVDIDLDANGTVKYFAVGTRLAGIGPTLGPGMGAVAVRADPPNDAGPGDVVQVWRTDPTPERVATGELRGVADDVATLALDAADAERIAGGDYRLLTLPNDPSADRQFASVLRGADETMATVTVREGSALADGTVGDIKTIVAAVRPADGSIDPIPSRARPLAVGDVLYLVARPETVREVEAAASATAERGGEGDA
ncbi:potassium transporter TrkA [Halarchaeum salinum]|uniref:RCK C-terminal domain-containing protein n=1 Tax=Halarchaeum salinum TaxID=489912 RepID=A0AAV3SAX3_9EURY